MQVPVLHVSHTETAPSEPEACFTGGRLDTHYPDPTWHTSHPASYEVATRQPIGQLSRYPLAWVCDIPPPRNTAGSKQRSMTGWRVVHNTSSELCAALGSRSCPYSFCSKRNLCRQSSTMTAVESACWSRRPCSAMFCSGGVPPSPESSVVRHSALHYSTFWAACPTRYPLPPACMEYRPRQLTHRSGCLQKQSLCPSPDKPY